MSTANMQTGKATDAIRYFAPPNMAPINATTAHEIIPWTGIPPEKKAREKTIGNNSENIFIPAKISFSKNFKEYLSTYKFNIDGHNSSLLMNSSFCDILCAMFMFIPSQARNPLSKS